MKPTIKTLALSLAAALGGIGLSLTAAPAQANPVNPAFGEETFHQAPQAPHHTVEARQLRDHPNEPYARWNGYSTFPVLTSAQRAMISNGARSGGSAGSTATIPYWTASITSPLDSKTYTMSMVGSSPYAATPSPTTITYVPIVLKVVISGTTYDPTLPACNDTVSVQNRFFNSPLFQAAGYSSNGVAITDQLASAFQRGNFWSNVGGSNYGVTLSPSVATPIVTSVTLRGTNHAATCKNGKAIKLGEISINTFDAAIQKVIAQYATPTQLPIVLTYNIVETQNGQCCILGYHNAISVSGGVQTYATGGYIDSGVFTNNDDIATWSHEITEWLDDPFVQAAVAGGGADDTTPSWGHVGQVSTCQTNLEVGDPLSGTEYPIAGAGGFTYHFQDLAYHDWFYRTAATGTGGKYSFMGTFTTSPPLC